MSADRTVGGRLPWSRGFVLAEPDRDTPVAKRLALYVCPQGHDFQRWFARDAEQPDEWECPHHSAMARRCQLLPPLPDSRPVGGRTHWDDVRKRRSIAELEENLAHALARCAQARGEPAAITSDTELHGPSV